MAPMRIALVLALTLALAACGKKQAPQSPAPDTQLDQEAEERDSAMPDEADDATPRSADPQEGGE
jgi:hypothetical protein